MMNLEKVQLEIAKRIGEPIDPNLPVPFEIQKIANIEMAEPGEHVYTYDAEDSDVDEVYQVNSDGTVSMVDANLVGDVELQFKMFNSPLKKIRVDEVLNSPDQGKLARIKKGLTRSFDKLEVYLLLKAMLDLPSIESVNPESGEDLYDVLANAISKIEDFGDGYVLLAGSDVYKAIGLYNKEKAGVHNYDVNLKKYLADENVEIVKVFGQIKTGNPPQVYKLLDPKKAILLAVNSRIANGKPIAFVRRKISAEIAKAMGANVTTAQRAIMFVNSPVPVSSGLQLSYGMFAVESLVMAILNPRVIKKMDLSSLV